MQPTLELVRLLLLLIGLLVPVFVVVLSDEVGTVALLPAVAFVLALCAGAWRLMRHLGSLPKIMEIAAWNDDAAARLRRDMALGMRNGRAYERLIELYRPIVAEVNKEIGPSVSFEFVSAGRSGANSGAEYAAIMLPDDTTPLDRIFSGPIDTERCEHLGKVADGRQRLMQRWRTMDSNKREIEDERGDNYRLCELFIQSTEHGVETRMRVGVATYGQIVRSCDALINEFALFAYLTGPLGSRWGTATPKKKPLEMVPAHLLRCLPWRQKVHTDARARPKDLRRHRRTGGKQPAPGANLFLRPIDRAAGIGIAVATLGKSEGAVDVYLGIRSGIVGTYPDTLHVVPAGMCNTNGTDRGAITFGHEAPSQYLETAMRCEFLEEWLKLEEFEKNTRRGWKDLVDDSWQEKVAIPMAEASDAGAAQFRFTGIAFDLLNLRPEVCAIIVVDTGSGTLNWEFDAIGFEGPLITMKPVEPTEIVQSGAAALELAKRARSAELQNAEGT